MTDAALVRQVLEGDRRAFTILVDRHAPTCLRFATRMLGNREDAEDAVQESLIRAYRALGSFDHRASFRTWLLTIVVNQCRTLASRRIKRAQYFVADDDALSRAAVADGSDSLALTDTIERALDLLDDAHREAFLLKHVEQLEYDEMSQITGVGVSALKMRVKRACAKLQAALREVHDAQP
jgi:RNA polymerase sigma-70 factor (ECF subfamily)